MIPSPLGPFQPCRHRRTLGRRLPAAHLGDSFGQPYGRFEIFFCTSVLSSLWKEVERRDPAPAPASDEAYCIGQRWEGVLQHILPGAQITNHLLRDLSSSVAAWHRDFAPYRAGTVASMEPSVINPEVASTPFPCTRTGQEWWDSGHLCSITSRESAMWAQQHILCVILDLMPCDMNHVLPKSRPQHSTHFLTKHLLAFNHRHASGEGSVVVLGESGREGSPQSLLDNRRIFVFRPMERRTAQEGHVLHCDM